MSNAFKGQTQSYQSPMGYGGGMTAPMGGQMGGYGTSFGGYDMGGGYGQSQQPQADSVTPPYQPSLNDLFAQYFAQQYYGGQAFDPFAATSLFGGGYGGGYGGGGGFGGGRGMGRAPMRGMRRERRPMRGELLA